MQHVHAARHAPHARDRDRVPGAIFGLALSAVAFLIDPAAATAVAGIVLAFVAFDWRVSSTAVLGVLVAATVLVSANYRLEGGAPIDLTAIRLVVLALLFAWVFGHVETTRIWPAASWHVNRPLGWLLATALAMLLANVEVLAENGAVADGLKRLAALAGFVAAYSLTTAFIATRGDVDRVIRVIVGVSVVGSIVALVERVTGSNPAAALLAALPFEKYQWTETMTRANGLRAYGTAAHPIEFGAMMSLVLPLSFYLTFRARTARSRALFAVATALIAAGMLAAVSRSSIIAAAAGLTVLAVLSRPRKGVMIVLFGLGAAATAAYVFPGVVDTLQRMFDPAWIAREEAAAYSGRMMDWPIVWEMVRLSPVIGVGYDLFSVKEYFFLDNQYLKFVLELGVFGLGIMVWLFGAIGAVGWKAARRARAIEDVPLEAALLGSAAGFGLLGFLFDTFGFFQVTTLFFIIVGLLVVLASLHEAGEPA